MQLLLLMSNFTFYFGFLITDNWQFYYRLFLRFCGQLPGDVFTRSVPRWSIHKQKHGFIGKLQLPIQSAVKTVVQV